MTQQYPQQVPYPQPQYQMSTGEKIGRVMIDMAKIAIAVAGGIAVYKLCENYFAEDSTPALPCTTGGSLPGPGFDVDATSACINADPMLCNSFEVF